MTGWALDLGTTNSGIARWDEGIGQPQLVELSDVCRNPERDDPLEAPRMVPSAVHLLESPGLVDRLGSWPPVARRMFLGRRALIGRPALERNREAAHPAGPGQLSLAGGEAGALSLADGEPGRLSLAEEARQPEEHHPGRAARNPQTS